MPFTIILQNTAAAFQSANPTLQYLQTAIETDTGLTKVGDGTTQWNDLNYNGFKVLHVIALGTNTYTSSASPEYEAYPLNSPIVVSFINGNTGASTLNINGLGAIPIKKSVSTALSSGDIITGQLEILMYDGTNFQMIGGAGGGGGSGSVYVTDTTVASQTAYTIAALSGKTIDFVQLENNILVPSQYTLVGTTFTLVMTAGDIDAGWLINIAYH